LRVGGHLRGESRTSNGQLWHFYVAAALGPLAFVLDALDGRVARWGASTRRWGASSIPWPT